MLLSAGQIVIVIRATERDGQRRSPVRGADAKTLHWAREDYVRYQMMVALLMYAYCQGERSSRVIEQRCLRGMAYRVSAFTYAQFISPLGPSRFQCPVPY
jgi:hypothetical protein